MHITTREEAQAKKKYFYNIKNNGRCALCKSNVKLTFHHRKPEEKLFNIASGTRDYRISFCSLVKEIKKCVILCDTCHKELEEKIRVTLKENDDTGNDSKN
jgi:hypothetical protein